MILIWLKQITYLHIIFSEYFPSVRISMSNRHSSKAINSIIADWKYTALYIGHLLYDNWSRSYKRANLRNYPVTSMSNSLIKITNTKTFSVKGISSLLSLLWHLVSYFFSAVAVVFFVLFTYFTCSFPINNSSSHVAR